MSTAQARGGARDSGDVQVVRSAKTLGLVQGCGRRARGHFIPATEIVDEGAGGS